MYGHHGASKILAWPNAVAGWKSSPDAVTESLLCNWGNLPVLPGVDISGCLNLFAGTLVAWCGEQHSYTVILMLSRSITDAPRHHQGFKMLLNWNQDQRYGSLMSPICAHTGANFMLDLGAKVESMIIGTGTGVATDCCCVFSGGTWWNLWKLDKSQPFVGTCRNMS